VPLGKRFVAPPAESSVVVPVAGTAPASDSFQARNETIALCACGVSGTVVWSPIEAMAVVCAL
jgi:hypothetical protein